MIAKKEKKQEMRTEERREGCSFAREEIRKRQEIGQNG